jgi:transposase InsO family protein
VSPSWIARRVGVWRSFGTPLARARQGHPPRLHQAPYPRLNGKVELSHRIDAEEFYRLLDGVVIDDINIFNARLKEWQDFYNYDRPHGGLDGQMPMRDSARRSAAEART